jgi:phage shock protein C
MKKLYKSRTDKKIDGVCAGIAKYLNLDPTIIRLLWIIMVVAAGSGVLAYILCMIIMPVEPDAIDE